MTPRIVDIPVLETDRMNLREPRAEDFPVLEPFICSDRATYVGGGAVKDKGHAWRILAILTGHWHLRGYGTYVAVRKDTGAPIGSNRRVLYLREQRAVRSAGPTPGLHYRPRRQDAPPR